MINFPNAKINIGLNITEKRSDGYHNLETIFYPIEINDVLEIIVKSNELTDVEFTSTGLDIDGSIENNLCVKAYQLLKKDFDLPSVHIHLHKQIPMGAGLGGGSANAAFALQLINNKFNLNITKNELINYALQLGSDCPFFILNKPTFAKGRGEILQEVNLDLSSYKILLVNPKIHVSTKEAFSNITPNQPSKSLINIIQEPIESWKENIINDFEKSIFNVHPTLKNIKEELYNIGATYAAMSGTGSTLYGFFRNENMPSSINFDENYFVQWV